MGCCCLNSQRFKIEAQSTIDLLDTQQSSSRIDSILLNNTRVVKRQKIKNATDSNKSFQQFQQTLAFQQISWITSEQYKESYKHVQTLQNEYEIKVHLVEEIKTSKQLIEIQVMKNKLHSKKKFIEQIKNQLLFDHENIISLHCVIDSMISFRFILDYCQLSLEKHLENLKKTKKQLNCERIIMIVYQILQGLYFLHQLQISHLHINPKNIFFVTVDKLNLQIQHHFYNITKLMVGKQNQNMYEMIYESPEVLTNQKWNQKADMWSVGIVALQLLADLHPFEKCISVDEIIEEQKNINYFIQFHIEDEKLKEWILKLLEVDIDKRSDCETALTTFIQDIVERYDFKNNHSQLNLDI